MKAKLRLTEHNSNSSQKRVYPVNPSPLRKVLSLLSKLIPGNYLKTFVYLNFIKKPRQYVYLVLTTFYRFDHVYTVLNEFKRNYKGNFSIIEFGTSDGYAFTKMLYATKYLGMAERVIVHTFDSFEGMPSTADARDQDFTENDFWVEGQFRGNYEELKEYCSRHYKNYQIHKGYFHDTLTPEFLNSLTTSQPVLIWIDCDYYTSAKTIFEKLVSHIPNGCVIYFDECDKLNLGSRFTGEARLIYEINHGLSGDDVELILDSNLSLNSKRIYRFFRYQSNLYYEKLVKNNWAEMVHRRTNDSPLP